MGEQYLKMEAIILDIGRMIKNADKVYLLESIKRLVKLNKRKEYGIKMENKSRKWMKKMKRIKNEIYIDFI